MRSISVDSSSSSSSSLEGNAKFKTIYAKQLNKMKKQTLQEKKKEKERERIMILRKIKAEEQEDLPLPPQAAQDCITLPILPQKKEPEVFELPVELKWFIYPKHPQIDIHGRVPRHIAELPIYRKKDAILDAITKNQVILVTGQTGCGKSTQVPRLIYEYLKSTGQKAKIMCVQPRRLAVINLQSILEKQMVERSQIGYQIGMKSHIFPENKIVFVTNGIFLQRMVHSTAFFNEYPFIILDEVHERDIDTDFILLTIKRVMRQYPKLRVILMSATIDNKLFRYYFAADHIDNILTQENFYKKVIRAKQQRIADKMKDEEDDYGQPDSDSKEEEQIYRKFGYSFLDARYPCPTINVTEPGKFTRTFYYLDTLDRFLPKGVMSSRWGSVIFSEKYPSTSKQLYESVCLVIDQVSRRNRDRVYKSSVLVFMPGLGEIEQLNEYISQHFRQQRIEREFELINVHSTILNDDITNKLLEKQGKKHKIIISTNIAESSITVMGVEYIIDFCLTKEVRFDLKSRMENLQLVWTSKASCDQRAGRTGRVCDGVVIRLLQQSFYDKLPAYSTPEIQRSSLDKLILRIKLLHEGENNQIFAEPGQVLGSAIQPPNLKNIDSAITSLKFCGGLQWRDNQFFLTNLGRLYIDIPIDITYCKLLVVSQLFGTYDDILTLVSILSQSKNAIRRNSIQRSYMKYHQIINNSYNCDFLSLIALYEQTQADKSRNPIRLEIFSEVKELKKDIDRRITNKSQLFPKIRPQKNRSWSLKEVTNNVKTEQFSPIDAEKEDYLFRFKMTLICGFIEHMLRVREATLDDKQEKRLRLMKKEGIRHHSTVCILGSNVLRKPESTDAEKRLVNTWRGHLKRAANIHSTDFTVTYGVSYLHFNNENELHKFLFYQYVQSNKKSCIDQKAIEGDSNYLSMANILKCFGEIDHMHAGRPVTFCREQTVLIDNYSLNRVVNMNEGDHSKFLITNNIAKQSSRMVARYTSLLPTNISYIEIIVHLLFYPFISVTPNRKKTRYQSVQLSKRKHKIPIKYNISNDEVQKANIVRTMLRDYLSLRPEHEHSFDDFWQLIADFIELPRPEVVEEGRWQQLFMKELFDKRPQIKDAFQAMKSDNMPQQQPQGIDYEEKQGDRCFMNEIKLAKLSTHFFSNITIADMHLDERVQEYNLWKQKKLRQVRAIERKAQDRDSYLACGEDSCGLKIAKMISVGPITNEIFRDLFTHESDNVEQLEFNDMDCHFCTLLMSNYINSEYKTYGCKNGHYFAIKLEGEKRLKILPFSELMIIYPDGSAEKAEFERMEVKDWKRKHDAKAQGKYKLKLSTYCFVCDQMLESFKNLEGHIRELKHIVNVKDFIKTIPEEMREGHRMHQKQQESIY